MFPASWRLLTVSKSNSSTLFPSTTTTRVSSAWVASMSIFLAMNGFRMHLAAPVLAGGNGRGHVVLWRCRSAQQRHGRAFLRLPSRHFLRRLTSRFCPECPWGHPLLSPAPEGGGVFDRPSGQCHLPGSVTGPGREFVTPADTKCAPDRPAPTLASLQAQRQWRKCGQGNADRRPRPAALHSGRNTPGVRGRRPPPSGARMVRGNTAAEARI